MKKTKLAYQCPRLRPIKDGKHVQSICVSGTIASGGNKTFGTNCVSGNSVAGAINCVTGTGKGDTYTPCYNGSLPTDLFQGCVSGMGNDGLYYFADWMCDVGYVATGASGACQVGTATV